MIPGKKSEKVQIKIKLRCFKQTFLIIDFYERNLLHVHSGLDNLHNLTAMTRMSLRVDLRDRDESVFAKYSTFDVAKKNYRLTVGGYSGTAGERRRGISRQCDRLKSH